MTLNLQDYQAADKSVLACAVFLTERINHPDGHAEAVENLVPVFLAKKDVDTAAALADSVENSFVRDKLLVKVAEKCAEIGDDEYAMQLAEAIEDRLFQDEARERIAIQKAENGDLENALKLADSVGHNSASIGAIAARFYLNGDENRALALFGKIEDSNIAIENLQNLALRLHEKGQTEKALNVLEKASAEAENLELPEEKVRALHGTGAAFSAIGRNDKAIEILAKANNLAENLTGVHRNALLNQISVAFLNAGSLELADRTLDAVNDKTVIAATLTHYAENYHKREEREEALEILEEAAALLKSQHEKETRNSQEKYSVMGTIAVQFAQFEKYERAIALALENPFEKERFSALSQIAQRAAASNRNDLAQSALGEIAEETARIKASLLVCAAILKNENTEKALEILREAQARAQDIDAPSAKIELLNLTAAHFHNAGEKEKARELFRESLRHVSKIYDESLRAVTLAKLGEIYDKLDYELTSPEREDLQQLLAKTAKF